MPLHIIPLELSLAKRAPALDRHGRAVSGPQHHSNPQFPSLRVAPLLATGAAESQEVSGTSRTTSRRFATPVAQQPGLERAKGWKRRGLAFLYLMIALMMGVIGWRAVCLWRLPNSPEPFDLATYGRVEMPDADNAMVAYREVFSRFGDLNSRSYKVASVAAWYVSDWSRADPEVRRWAEDHQTALEAWLLTNDRPDSLLVQPEDLRMRTDMDPLQSLRPYVRLALLEGSRLEQSGDLAGTWRMDRAALRASRHAARHGGTNQRLMGNGRLRTADSITSRSALRIV